jgi:plastocyanin
LKIILKSVFIIAIVAVAMIGVMVPITFGQNQDRVFIETVDEAGFDSSCPVLGCYTPAIVIVSVGDIVTMTNMDSTVHSFTSGGERSSVESEYYPGYFPKISDGVFDSDVILPKKSFSWIPENAGKQPYYCKYHSWMTGMIIVNGPNKVVPSNPTTTTIEPTVEVKSKKLGTASFIDQTKNPRHYIDRYYNEPLYKEWFDQNYPQYISIYQAVGLTELEYRLAEIEDRAAEKKAAEKKAAEKKAAEKKAAEARAAEAAIRAAEAKAAQDPSNFLIIAGAAIAIISLLMILSKMKNKKSTSNTSQPTRTNTYSPPNPPSTNTESSTMFFYECPKCHSADIVNNPDGSVNCPDCGYRG